MTQMTIALPPHLWQALVRRAEEQGVAPEDLVRVGVEALLAQSDDAYQRVVDQFLQQHADRVRRMA